MNSPRPFLADADWKTFYSHEDGNLMASPYEPAQNCRVLFRRLTGYFSDVVLGVIAQGLLGLS